MEILTDIILIILAITFTPLILGVIIALIIGATGFTYFAIVMTTAIIIWTIICLWWSL